MKIGEFAKRCGTKISVLRHYDKEKLLIPEHTDEFSGYRYYASEQILVFHRINALKKAGFSLQEIKDMIAEDDDEKISKMFLVKEQEFLSALKNLKEAKLMLTKLNILYKNNKAVLKIPKDADSEDLCTLIEKEIKAADYQRTSQYTITEDAITCDVIKLDSEVDPPEENLPFENDEKVIGKWEIIGIYAVRADFYENLHCVKNFYGDEQKYIYFLPDGERYWSYSWTKGYLNSPINNEYETEQIGEDLFMFVSLKEYEYTRGGIPTCLVLKKADSERYSAESIARKDDIDKPFIYDERVVGKWTAHSFLGWQGGKSEFTTEREPIDDLYFKEIEFYPDGNCKCVYEDDIFEGEDVVTWTQNYLLRKWNWSACEYEIRKVDSTDYMIIEWKSGDYRYGGYDTNYYVFIRA